MRVSSGIQRALRPIVHGLIAGAAGGILIDVYLLTGLVAIAHVVTVTGFYQFVASAAVGRDAYVDGSEAWLGVALHVFASLAWGVGYAYLASRTPQLRSRPITSGIVFGIVVMIAMQLVEVAANVYTLPDTLTLLNAFVAHTLFFGIPVAWLVAKRLPST
jgi:uncharacterized membrane protein YagU involved in acid resistance